MPQDAPLGLRERKKQRTRTLLANAALRLFEDQGYEVTTLEQIVNAVEVSKRTFFRFYSAKEDVALEAERQLLEAYLGALEDQALSGSLVDLYRSALHRAVEAMEPGWDSQFASCRRVALSAPAVAGHSMRQCAVTADRVVATLQARLETPPAAAVLRLSFEAALSAWRIGVEAWLRDSHSHDRRQLQACSAEAFVLLPEALQHHLEGSEATRPRRAAAARGVPADGTGDAP